MSECARAKHLAVSGVRPSFASDRVLRHPQGCDSQHCLLTRNIDTCNNLQFLYLDTEFAKSGTSHRNNAVQLTLSPDGAAKHSPPRLQSLASGSLISRHLYQRTRPNLSERQARLRIALISTPERRLHRRHLPPISPWTPTTTSTALLRVMRSARTRRVASEQVSHTVVMRCSVLQ